MKKLVSLFVCLFSVTLLAAQVPFVSGGKYRMVSVKEEGNIVLGTHHGSTALLYNDITYYSSANIGEGGTVASPYPSDAWWVITEGANGGYTFKNNKTGQYMTYDPEVVNGVKKGISLADAAAGAEAEWNMTEETNGIFIFSNISAPTHYMNLRTINGVNRLLGTYENAIRVDNERFKLYDENGEQVASSEIVEPEPDPDPDPDPNPGTSPWDTLVVVSSPTSQNAKAYPIRNLRSGNYACYTEEYSKELLQSSYNDAVCQWVFVAAGAESNGVLPVKLWNTRARMYLDDISPVIYTSDSEGATVWALGAASSPYGAGYEIANLLYHNYGVTKYLWNDNSNASVCYWTLDDGSVWAFDVGNAKPNPDVPSYGNLEDYVDSLRINGMTLVYDNYNAQYMYALPSSLQHGGNFQATFTYKAIDPTANYTFKIDDVAADANGVLTLSDLDGRMQHSLKLMNGTTEIASVPIMFTFMPIVEVNVPSCNGSYYTQGTFAVHDPDNWTPGADSVYHAKFKWRGATAQGQAKKAYAVKIIDANGNKLDAKFLDLRNDNNWILDAAAIDPSRMRNRVSTDLWNDFASKPYYADRERKARTGTRGKFVEVIYNGTYQGIYCMTEKMDRKQMKLKKFDELVSPVVLHGGLYKTSQWSYEVLMGHESGSQEYPGKEPSSFYNFSETWANHEVKYPDVGDGETIDWQPMWDAVNFVATSSDATFNYEFERYFNQNTVNDYWLFIELLLATDNHGKNMFWGVYDMQDPNEGNKMEIGVWDLDGTWGRNWSGDNSYTPATEQDFVQFLWDHEHGPSYLFIRALGSGFLNTQTLLAQRYGELRRTHFAEDALIKRFTDYGELFAASGADEREESRWRISDLQMEVASTAQWISERLQTLDNVYNYDPTTVGINHYIGESPVVVYGGNGMIRLFSSLEKNVGIYNVNGQLLHHVELNGNIVTIDGLVPGIYIVEGKKIVVK